MVTSKEYDLESFKETIDNFTSEIMNLRTENEVHENQIQNIKIKLDLNHKLPFDKILEKIEDTDINALIIDVKDYSGFVGYNTDNELVKKYKSESEKVKYWEVIIKYFTDKNVVKNIFKVFKLESQKGKILDLVRKYPLEECFPDMIAFIQKDFPQECFTEYKKKVEEILKETDTEKYPIAVYHLKRMQKIGLDKNFDDFIIFTKNIFKRRSSLMRELQENQL